MTYHALTTVIDENGFDCTSLHFMISSKKRPSTFDFHLETIKKERRWDLGD